MKKVSTALLCAVLAACGGGGGGNGDGNTGAVPPASPAQPAPVPVPTLTLSSTTLRTVAGGTPVALTSALSTSGTVRWKLADGAPGSLSADTGTAVRYIPPAGDIPGLHHVPVTATGDGASATLVLDVGPRPGAPRVTVLAGHTNPTSTDGQQDTPASFPHAQRLAVDGKRDIYILQSDRRSPDQPAPVILRKMTDEGYVTTLADAGTWFGVPDKDDNRARLAYQSGFAADRDGNLYVSTSAGGSPPATAAILKITPAGIVSVLAGSEKPASATMKDGTGGDAVFARPAIVGIDPEGNLYVRDAADTPRKVAPDGVVTTLKAFPASLNADMNGNTYSVDAGSRALMRKAPDGRADAIVGYTGCSGMDLAEDGLSRFCLGAAGTDIALLDGANLVLLNDDRVLRVTLPLAEPAFTLTSTTQRTIASGAPVLLEVVVDKFGNNAADWKLGDGAPGSLSASSGASVTYTPPATVSATTLVPVIATLNGTSARVTIAVTPDPGPAGLSFIAGSTKAGRADGVGAQASFLYPANMATDLAGNIYVREFVEYTVPTPTPGFVLRKITPGGKVTTLVKANAAAADYWFGRPDPGGYALRTGAPNGMVVDSAGNVYLGQTRGSPRNSAGIMKITPAGTLSLLAGDDYDVRLPANADKRPVLQDGVGSDAHFSQVYVARIDYDDAMYVYDKANIARKVGADGTVTTVSQVPMHLQRDMHGNTYAYNQQDRTVVRISLSGETSVVAGTPGCTALKLGTLPGCLPDDLRETIVYGGNALLLRYPNYVVKLVLPH